MTHEPIMVEDWMQPYRDTIWLPFVGQLETQIDDEAVQAQLVMLTALRERGMLADPGAATCPKCLAVHHSVRGNGS